MRIRKNVNLKKYSTFKIGGKASLFVEVQNIEDLKEAVVFAKAKKFPIFILGDGSNILLPDKILKSVVIKINIKGIDFKENKILVGAGENWDKFIKKTLDKKLYGLENLSAIPGTVGATPIQNVGAYGAEVSSFIKEVRTLDKRNLREKIFSNKECEFSYRNSFFKTSKGKNFIVIGVVFSLNKKDKPNISYKDLKNYFGKKTKPKAKEVRLAVIKIRSKKFPNLKKYGTAGSFFKNPIITPTHYKKLLKKFPNLPGFSTENKKIKVPLAFILDKILGLTDFKLGETGLYKKQPLVFVNFNKAKQRDVLRLQKFVTKNVFDKTKIKITPEVTIIK